ncbi:phage tail protein [Phyllobacterium meliloti]|uniref:phage tail protein n=1 Tax=Phyllobacterium meliloti TaxID=555317 RepID=UPI001D15275F|nr:phage tail protein [Phyllobacterium sp. T1293]UGX87131.1 phage tail protein [Phyllobacterium sp. T1293]
MPVFAGLTTAIGGLLGGTFLSGIGGILLKAVVGVGLSFAAQALAGKPKEQKFSVNGKLQSGGDVSRSFILGHTVTAGSLVYANTWTQGSKTPNKYFTQVIALSDLPIAGLTQFFVNGEAVTIDPILDPDDKGFQIAEYRRGSDNHLWIRFHDGTQTAADSLLVNKVSSSVRPWQSTRIGTGVAYAVVTAQVDAELFTGFPQFKFEVQGTKLYDPSRDSSVGGSGTQRFDTPSTWGGDGDDLPAVQIYNLLRGITYGASWLYGLQGLAATRLPTSEWIAQINKCRALIAGPDGNEATYLTGGEVQLDAQLADAIEAILTGCQGKLTEYGGLYSIYVGAPDAPTFAFDDSQVLSTEEQEFTPFFGLADTINGISATYPEPKESWNTKTAPALTVADLEAEDGNRRMMADVQYDMVYRASQVQRLMRSALLEARRARRHTLVLPPEFWPYAVPGAVCQFTSVRNGYVGKLFRIDGVADKGNLDVTVDMTEVDPSDYDWNQGTDYTPPIFVPITPSRPDPQPIIDWFVAPENVPDNNGVPRRPGIRLSWDGAQEDVIGVEFEVRLASSLVTIYQGRMDQPTIGSLLISQGLLPNTLYGVRGRYIPGTARSTLWSGWLNVTTANVLLGSEDIYTQDIVDEVNQEIGGHLEWAGNTTRWLTEKVQQIDDLIAETGAQSTTDKFELLASIGSVTASYTRDIQVVATATQAAVSRIETLEVNLAGVPGQIAAVATAVDALTVTVTTLNGVVTAQATAITNLNVSVGSVSANGLFRVETTATESGALSTIGLSASATSGGVTTQAALFISAQSGGISTVTIRADRFVISNGTNIEAPFIFVGGVAQMQAARINVVTAGMLRSSDSKMQIDLTNKRILISD